MEILEGLDEAIAWFSKRNPPMPGARRMYRIAYSALKALKAYSDEQLDGKSRDDLIGIIRYLRAANINRGLLIDELETQNYEMRCKLEGGIPDA